MIRTRYIALLSIAAGLVGWEAIGRLSPPVLFSPASAAFAYLWHQTATLALPAAIGGSLVTLATGFALAVVVALPLGFAMGRVFWVHEMLHPILTAIPPAAFIPFLIVWFGLFAQSRVAIVVIMCFFEMLTITATGARAIDRRLLDVAHSFPAPRFRLIGAVRIERRWLDVGRSFGASRVQTFRDGDNGGQVAVDHGVPKP